MSKYSIEIPEGYEVDSTFTSIGTVPSPRIELVLKKKQTKDFLWYIDRYLDISGSSTSDEIVNWFEYQQADALKHKLKTSQFSLVPWEIKIGLFKFICEENGLDKDDILMLVTVWNTKNKLYSYAGEYIGLKVTRICSSLMEDIFNTKA